MDGPHSLTRTMNEQSSDPRIDQEFYESPRQGVIESPTSTIPLEETSSDETASIIVIPDDQVTRVHSLREVTFKDYACRTYCATMDAATADVAVASNPRSKPGNSKPGKPKPGKRKIETTDFDSMIVRTQAIHLLTFGHD
jgi:hypothetical protein